MPQVLYMIRLSQPLLITRSAVRARPGEPNSRAVSDWLRLILAGFPPVGVLITALPSTRQGVFRCTRRAGMMGGYLPAETAVPDPRPITLFQMKLLKLFMAPYSRWNAGRYLKSEGTSMGKFAGRDICVVTMKGAKSGQTRHVPLMYVPHKDGVILVASLGGAPKHPTWYYNLVANPDIEVQVRDRVLPLRARRASAEEKAEVWPTCVECYPDYDLYQRRTKRDIPVFICEPR
jgi:F420H(2)-dependent quinone reductase